MRKYYKTIQHYKTASIFTKKKTNGMLECASCVHECD